MNAGLLRAVAESLAHRFGQPVEITARHALAGGSINHTARITTTVGSFVLKTNAQAPAGLFDTEAHGLRLLRASGTSLGTPDVVAVGPESLPFLVLEDLGSGTRGPTFDDDLGRGLALLHRSRAPSFGLDRDNFCGTTPQPNPWTTSWVDFYAHARLEHQVRLARNRGIVTNAEAAMVDRLIGALGRWLGEPPDGPALIHGDLWSGNLHVASTGRPAILDPSVYYAHREAEFGMLTWFGGVGPRVYSAYDEAFPFEPGWRDRVELYRLYHVLNHANLFGGSYVSDGLAIARRYAPTGASRAR